MIEQGIEGNLVSPRASQGGQNVLFTTTNTAKTESANASERARAAGLAAQAAAQSAAQSAAAAARTAAMAAQATAQSAASGVSSGVQQGVYSARRWTAPQLELAADHVTKTLAPNVSAALRSSAKQVKPAEPSKGRSALTWSLLGAAILATAGAAFALIRYQFRSATADETVEVGETTDVAGAATTPRPTPTAPVTPTAPASSTAAASPTAKTAAGNTAAGNTAAGNTATTTDTSVNGHATSSGR
jgi:trimeric autotransporter adhesin